jgi:hypothetical protein
VGVWLRVEADTPVSAKIQALSSDGARWVWFETICAAKRQRPGGVFQSVAHWRKVINPGVPGAIKEMVKIGLVHEAPALCPKCQGAYGDAPAGSIVVHDFHDYNLDATSTERSRRHRERMRNLAETQTKRSGDAPETLPGRYTETETETKTKTGLVRLNGPEPASAVLKRSAKRIWG